MHLSRSARAGIAAGVLLLLVPAAAGAKTTTVPCKGNEASCVATVSLTGGASNVKLKVELPGTNLKRWATQAQPASVEGAYSLKTGGYSLGGSLYTTTLNAVQSIGKGATLKITFKGSAKSEGTETCPATIDEVTRIKVTALGMDQAKGAFGCKRANRVADGWMRRFGTGTNVKSFTIEKVAYTCKLVPGDRNTLCLGGGTSVAFVTPTGE